MRKFSDRTRKEVQRQMWTRGNMVGANIGISSARKNRFHSYCKDLDNDRRSSQIIGFFRRRHSGSNTHVHFLANCVKLTPVFIFCYFVSEFLLYWRFDYTMECLLGCKWERRRENNLCSGSGCDHDLSMEDIRLQYKYNAGMTCNLHGVKERERKGNSGAITWSRVDVVRYKKTVSCAGSSDSRYQLACGRLRSLIQLFPM